MKQNFQLDEQFSLDLDAMDPLQHYREEFYIPKDTIYVDGNSLGLCSKEAEQSLQRVVEEWKTLGIRGWFEPEKPWFHFGETLGALSSSLVGAKPEEVIATGTTTVNLHSLVSTFYKPQAVGRTKILADELDFPTDIYALKSQILLKGLDPKDHLLLVPSEDGRTLDENQIVNYMDKDVALIVLPSALYRSGQLLDMKYITKEANKRRIPIGWDCCHSVGAVPHYFDEWGVDFAFWCSYKYLNSGPGGTAFLYINEKHFKKEPGLTGWFGYIKEKQFEMSHEFQHAQSAGGWQISSSNILCSAPIEGSLNIILKAGIDNIRKKSILMTSYLIYLIENFLLEDPYNFQIGTPRNPAKRTGHIALEHDTEAYRISECLKENYNVITDFRPPNIIRIAPIPLYNQFHDIWLIIKFLRQIMDKNEYEEIKKPGS
ncbi:MAG: kynureninase [Candidatus Hodarchaeales archaeon]|jgi:kynureninase